MSLFSNSLRSCEKREKMLRDICLKKRYSKLKKMNLYCSLDNLTYQDFIGNSTPETKLTVYLQTTHCSNILCLPESRR